MIFINEYDALWSLHFNSCLCHFSYLILLHALTWTVLQNSLKYCENDLQQLAQFASDIIWLMKCLPVDKTPSKFPSQKNGSLWTPEHACKMMNDRSVQRLLMEVIRYGDWSGLILSLAIFLPIKVMSCVTCSCVWYTRKIIF